MKFSWLKWEWTLQIIMPKKIKLDIWNVPFKKNLHNIYWKIINGRPHCSSNVLCFLMDLEKQLNNNTLTKHRTYLILKSTEKYGCINLLSCTKGCTNSIRVHAPQTFLRAQRWQGALGRLYYEPQHDLNIILDIAHSW